MGDPPSSAPEEPLPPDRSSLSSREREGDDAGSTAPAAPGTPGQAPAATPDAAAAPVAAEAVEADAAAAGGDVVLPPGSSASPPRSANGAGQGSSDVGGSTGKATPVEGEEDDVSEGHVRSHVEQVAELMRQAPNARDKLEKWYGSRGLQCRMPTHVESVYQASGIMDYEGRADLVRLAIERQQKMLLEKRSKKKLRDKLREAAGLPKADGEVDEASGGAVASKAPPDDAGGFAAYGVELPLECGWSKVRDFKTMEEAMHFVMECQPIDYRPLSCYLGPEGFPKFESTQKAFQYVMGMEKVPEEFTSMESKFCRRLRVRRLADDEIMEARATSGHSAFRKKKGLKANRGARLLETVLAAQELKAFVVEAAGVLFERPPSLRCLNNHAANTRFFIAVSPEIEKKVLCEGYRVRRRCSIPCSATPKEARDHFRKESGEKQAGRPTSPRVSVLAVSIPAELGIDVVAHKAGGFLIKTKELPPGCFTRLRRPGAGGESN